MDLTVRKVENLASTLNRKFHADSDTTVQTGALSSPTLVEVLQFKVVIAKKLRIDI